MTTALLLSIFLGALVSGWHCALMCGGIAVAIEKPVRIVSRRRLMLEQLVMHLGRIGTYAALGGLAGTVGAVFWQQNWLPVQRLMFALAAVLLLLQSVVLWRGRMVATGRVEAWLMAISAKWWQTVTNAILARGGYAAGMTGWRGRLLAGAAWGLVPCGLIYAVLPYAFLAGSGWAGASVMLVFGLGTLPNLLLISGFSARLAGMGHQRWARMVAAGLMAMTGLFGLYRALTLSNDMLRGGFCLTH
jgi:hypothetical protein